MNTTATKHGGARKGAGRPAQTTDGGPLQRKTITIDATTVSVLTSYGDGSLSDGVRRAARAVQAGDDSNVAAVLPFCRP